MSDERVPLGLQEEMDALREMAAESQMRAHQWMQRHDRIAAGKDGGPYPSAADLPEALLSMQGMREALVRIASVVSYPVSTELRSRGWDPRRIDEGGSEYIAEIALAALKEPPFHRFNHITKSRVEK